LWFRTCSTFHGQEGKEFAASVTNVLGKPVAAHTHIIGVLQSGLHVARPGVLPKWSSVEGYDNKKRGVKESGLFSPNTISFLDYQVPAKFWD
jgi:hypothetical protein